jgi:exonuclease SbcD
VRLLHTSDWHVGKAIRGRSRSAEHQAVLAEIAGIAESQSVDLVVVAGDLFDTATPTAESERIVYRALLDLAAGGRPVVVVAGNHDSAQRLAAVAPLSEASGIHVAAAIRPPTDGGVLELDVDGETALLALLPFPSQRYVVTADLLLSGDAADAHAAYADRVVRILGALTAGFRADTVNLVVAHLMVMGGVMGGGERGAHTVFDYWVPATAFPAAAQYVALGHLHRPQTVAGPAPLHYCGSPLQLDFGESANDPVVHVVDVRPGLPAQVRAVPLTAGRRLRTLRGPLADVLARAAEAGDDHLRVVLDERARVGLADEVRAAAPHVVEVALAPRDDDEGERRRVADPDRLRRTPRDLLAEYLEAQDALDERVLRLFDELVEADEAAGSGSGSTEPGEPGGPDGSGGAVGVGGPAGSGAAVAAAGAGVGEGAR